VARLWFILVLAALVFWVYSIVDCAMQPPTRHRGVGKVWWMLIVLLLPVVFPAIAFAGAFALGWRRRILPLVLVMLTGLTLVAVFWLNVFALAVTSTSMYAQV